VLFHGLRNALLPMATLAALEGPMALGGAFVVERVFDLPGLGDATIRAVQRRDISWLMALSMCAAALSAIFVVLTDVAYALIDHRVEPLIVSDKGRA
jgi:peptide/nickel transport system permease protein